MHIKKRLGLVYLSGFLLAIHFASVAYINSSLLKQFIGDNVLSALYIVGSLLAISFLILAPWFLKKFGSIFTFLFFIALESLAVFGMGIFKTAPFIIPLFLLHLAADSILYFCLDINLEQETTTEKQTGSKRGTLLTIANLAWVVSPLALTFLINQNSFSNIYFVSGTALIPLFIIVALFFKNTKEAPRSNTKIFNTLKALWQKKDQLRIVLVQLILNFFYAWMVIYSPLLLNKEMGFGWDKIGIIFTIMLLPFLLFELPAGILSDKKFGEKEILITGFIIMFLATIFIPNLHYPIFWIWATVLFVSRIGASLVEASSESYFFKHVKEEDTGFISLFRVARPFSFVIAPLIALPIVSFFSYSQSFYFLSCIVLLGLLFIPKVDTR